MIAGYHLSRGKTVGVVDAEAEGLSLEQTVNRVESLNPKDIIVVVMGNNPSVSSTPKMPIAEEFCSYFRRARMTGLHPIAVDYPGVIRAPFEGTPDIPWHLFPMDKYRAHNWHCLADIEYRDPYAVLYTSMNCPFNCFYCNVHTLYGNRKVRYRQIVKVFSDIDLLVTKYNIRNIKIWDELFCLNIERVNDICNFIISQGYDLNIWAYARADVISREMLAKMKRAGINWLAYGFESVNMNKGSIQRAIDMTKDAGINIIGNFMFGLLDETIDDMKRSLDIAIRGNFEFVNFHIALPYPGSDWYNSLKVKPVDWSGFNQYGGNICADPKIVKFRDEAFQSYFTRPEYLSMIKTKFGEKAEAHIKEMTQWKMRT